MAFWFESDTNGKMRLFHSCHRSNRDLAPSHAEIERSRVYEDGYYRGVIAGKRHSGLKGSPYSHNIIKCKACGEEHIW